MRWFVITADYRPRNENKPRYAFHTNMDVKEMKVWFEKAYPWLTIFDVQEVTEDELPDGLKMWVLSI